MIKDIREINFPEYATLEQATITINDMGDRSISTQVKIDGSVVPDFSYDWEVEFKGERYIHPVRKPQGTKDNASMSAKIDMVFYHWAIYEMKRHYFVEMASTTAGTSIADKYIASLGLNLGNFVTAFNLVLKHYFGERIVVKLNPEWQYDAEAQFMSISYSYIWDVLQQMHDIYGVRWTLKTNVEGVCEILMGYPAEEVSHIFEYGFEGGLLSVQRQVQSTDIRNRLLGRGGEKNLPYRYFKDKDPKNPLFEADPDWIPELANIAFTELRGKTFRDYVKGWKAKHYDGAAMDEPTEAYLAGYNAEKFDPTEYVEDKESIAKYGVLIGALENNSEIYPSIQGAPGDVDKIVDAEQVVDDDVDVSVENDSVVVNLDSWHQTDRSVSANSTVTIKTLTKRDFTVPEGKIGTLDMSVTATGKYSDWGKFEKTYPILKPETVKVTVLDRTTGAEVMTSSLPVINIPSGEYSYVVSADVESNYDKTTMITLNIESVYLYTSDPEKPSGWKSTFDIWVRNIWGSTRNAGETDEQYASRVWTPILGDRTGEEARVVFASGWLSFSSDWEFPIVGYAYDDSKEGSHWRLTLAKSEAELEASGKYIPYEGYNASSGDRFFFIGIDMPHQYVLWAEERLDNFKQDSLLKTSDINPTWVIKTDKVRLNQDREGAVLVDSLNAGAQIRLASKQFISGAYETLYVQSMTYTWGADTILHPDVEIVVSDKVYTVKNPVAQIQSSIETIQRQVGSLSNIQQIIRQVCDTLYLRKDGVSDISKSPTKFLGRVTGEKFREGQIGGRDWGIYRDESGKSIAEFDKIIIREMLSVAELEINHVTHMGGTRVVSQAEMECISVEDTPESYLCYFDQKQGTKVNLFTEGDIVWSQNFDADNVVLKYYKSVVVGIGDNYIELSKAQYDGEGIPSSGDVIIQAGNTSDINRQAIIIIDATGNPSISLYRGVDSFELPEPETRIQSGNNVFTGKVHMELGSDGLQNLYGDINIGGQNMLRNSGFTGDYLSEPLADEAVLEASKQMYNDQFIHWGHGMQEKIATIPGVSTSGYGVAMAKNGILYQELYFPVLKGESYTFSFKARANTNEVTAVIASFGGSSGSAEITSDWKMYSITFSVSESSTDFRVMVNNAAVLCDLKLEKGTVATAWSMSILDNSSDRAYYESIKAIENALNGYTDVLGGLVLTNHIKVGDQSNNKKFVEHGGVNGLYADDNSPAFWAGANFDLARLTAQKYETESQTPEGEAPFVVTHGGKVIMNDAIVRGTIYANDGIFNGTVNATNGTFSGKITAEEGVVGPFSINYWKLTSTSGGSELVDNVSYKRTDTIELASSFLGVKTEITDNSGQRVGFSQCTLYPAAGAMSANYSAIIRNYAVPHAEAESPFWFEEAPCVALIIGAKGANNINREGYGGNFALQIEDGMVSGLRPQSRVIKSTSNVTLNKYDHTVVMNIESGTGQLTLPQNPQEGQRYEIYTCHAPMDLKIYMNGQHGMYNFIDAHTFGANDTESYTSDKRRHIVIFFAGGQWWETYRYLEK